jgi:hypothetical protein
MCNKYSRFASSNVGYASPNYSKSKGGFIRIDGEMASLQI